MENIDWGSHFRHAEPDQERTAYNREIHDSTKRKALETGTYQAVRDTKYSSTGSLVYGPSGESVAPLALFKTPEVSEEAYRPIDLANEALAAKKG